MVSINSRLEFWALLWYSSYSKKQRKRLILLTFPLFNILFKNYFLYIKNTLYRANILLLLLVNMNRLL